MKLLVLTGQTLITPCIIIYNVWFSHIKLATHICSTSVIMIYCDYSIMIFNSYDHYQRCLRANIPSHIYSIPGGEMPTYGDRVAFNCQR